MTYEYKNQFNIDYNTKQILSELISIKESTDINCEVLNITIPEHSGTVTMFKKGNPYEGQYHLLNGARWQDLYENYSYEGVGTIEKEDVQIFLVIEKQLLKIIKQKKIGNKQELIELLNKTCEYWTEYDGILKVDDLIKRYPYLKNFFNYLDKWREKTGLVTVNKEVLESGFQKIVK